MPTATAWASEELSDFCHSADFGLGFVPTGAPTPLSPAP